MDSTCSMIGCYNSSENLGLQQFYSFPKDFDLCMLWVQNCGRAELFEDFAYGGAQPFINKIVCSDHFNNSDFNYPNCISNGLKHEAVPNLNTNESHIMVVKEEDSDLDDFLTDDPYEFDKTECTEAASKLEKLVNQESESSEAANFYSNALSNQLKESIHSIFYDDIEPQKLLGQRYIPLFLLSKNKVRFKGKDVGSFEFQKSQKAFKIAWKRALESAEQRGARNKANALRNAFRRANETEEQKKVRNQANAVRNASRRASESTDEKKDRLYKNAVRAALRRSMESENEQQERRRKNALRAAFRRSVETEKQRTERRLKDKIRSAERRKQETEIQSKLRKYNDAVRAAYRRNNENDEQRQQRRKYDVMRAARRRSNENTEQRMKRLQADRERAAKRRMLKKVSHGNSTNMSSEFFGINFCSPINRDNYSSNGSMQSDSNLEYTDNDTVEDNYSNDDLSSYSGSTYSEVNEHNNVVNINNRNHILNVHESKNCNAFCANVMNEHNLKIHNLQTEIRPSVTTEKHTVPAAEVVWCT